MPTPEPTAGEALRSALRAQIDSCCEGNTKAPCAVCAMGIAAIARWDAESASAGAAQTGRSTASEQLAEALGIVAAWIPLEGDSGSNAAAHRNLAYAALARWDAEREVREAEAEVIERAIALDPWVNLSELRAAVAKLLAARGKGTP